MNEEPKLVTYFRNFIFGVEDSLVSTVGLLSGIAVASVSRSTILVAGIILILVEAFSMGAGSFLSEHSAEDYIHGDQNKSRKPIIGSIIMFCSYFVSGFIPLFPYIILPVQTAFWVSIGLSLGALFILGIISGKISKTGIIKSAFRMTIIGGVAIAIGVIVGKILAGLNV